MTADTDASSRPQRALGRRPPSNKRSLRLRDFLISSGVPAHPIAVDDMGQVQFGLDENDKFGVCGPTSFDNLQRLVTGLLRGAPLALTQAQVFQIYRWINPTFDPNADPDPATGQVPGDNGVDLQSMLEQLLAHGWIVGFAKVDLSSDEEVRAATYLFLGVILGVNLQQAQDAQTDKGTWTYVRNSPHWGGHAVMQGAYESADDDVVSWARRVRMTPSFISHCREEAWVVLLQDHLEHPDFRAGFNAPAFAAAFQQITDSPFPGRVPEPSPVDPAAPGADADDQVLAAVLTPWLQHNHTGQAATVANGARAWLAAKGIPAGPGGAG